MYSKYRTFVLNKKWTVRVKHEEINRRYLLSTITFHICIAWPSDGSIRIIEKVKGIVVCGPQWSSNNQRQMPLLGWHLLPYSSRPPWFSAVKSFSGIATRISDDTKKSLHHVCHETFTTGIDEKIATKIHMKFTILISHN